MEAPGRMGGPLRRVGSPVLRRLLLVCSPVLSQALGGEAEDLADTPSLPF